MKPQYSFFNLDTYFFIFGCKHMSTVDGVAVDGVFLMMGVNKWKINKINNMEHVIKGKSGEGILSSIFG